MSGTSEFLTLLEQLPGSYAGATRPLAGPYALVGVGEGTLAADLLRTLIGTNFTRTGTQFVLSSADAADAARTYAELAEVAGAEVRRLGTGGQAEDLDALVPGGALATYHFAQAVAYAAGHAEAAQAADQAMSALAARCAPHVEEDNPARDLAWSLWGRAPLMLAAPDAEALPHAWQALMARVAKTLAIPATGDILPLVTGAFEAQHEHGDGRLALLLGDLDPALEVAREVLQTRIDEVIHVPYPPENDGGYSGQLALWYFGAWVSAYLAERYKQSPADPPMLARVQAALTAEGEGLTPPPLQDVRRTRLEPDWEDEQDGPDGGMDGPEEDDDEV